MKRLSLFCFTCLALPVCSHTLAGIQIDLIPDHEGPYLPNEIVTVDFWLSTEDIAHYIRTVRFDFRDTNVELTPSDQFMFDLGAVPSLPNGWWVFSDMPRPYLHRAIDIFCEDPSSCEITILPAAPVHIGSIDVEMPDNSGTLRFDAMNADEPDWIAGGAFVNDYDSGLLHAYDGSLTGGTFDFEVVPEPQSLSLIVLIMAYIGRNRIDRRPATR